LEALASVFCCVVQGNIFIIKNNLKIIVSSIIKCEADIIKWGIMCRIKNRHEMFFYKILKFRTEKIEYKLFQKTIGLQIFSTSLEKINIIALRKIELKIFLQTFSL
jgi:hypothetical protein